MDEFKKSFAEIIELHNNFAEALKIVEHFIDSIDTTTLNDSRYALRAVIDCIDATFNKDGNDFEKHHSLAMNALRIAWHDIVDIMHDEFKIYLDELAKKYGPDIVAKQIKLADCHKCIRKVQDLITESRGDREKRIDLYQQINKSDLHKMLELYRDCVDMEPAIASAFKKERKGKLISKTTVTIATLSLITGITSASLLTYFNSKKDSDVKATISLPNGQAANNEE